MQLNTDVKTYRFEFTPKEFELLLDAVERRVESTSVCAMCSMSRENFLHTHTAEECGCTLPQEHHAYVEDGQELKNLLNRLQGAQQ